MSDQSEGASPICPCRIFVCAHHIPGCPNDPGPSGAQDAPIKNCEHERVDEDGYCRKCGSDTRGGFCLAQDAPQPQSEERRNALESLLPGRAVNAAQTDWGKGYIEGWLARAKSQPQSAVIAEICSAFIELVDEYHAPDWDTNCRL